MYRIRRPLKNCIDGRNHPIEVTVEVAPGIHGRSIDECKTLKTFRKLLRPRHVCLSDKYRNSWNTLAECRLHFNSNRIGVVRNSAVAAFADPKPSRPDDNEDRIRLRKRLLNVNSEIRPKWYVIDVYEYGILAEGAGDPIANASSKCIQVRATI